MQWAGNREPALLASRGTKNGVREPFASTINESLPTGESLCVLRNQYACKPIEGKESK